mgnify:CR=1 FL=1
MIAMSSRDVANILRAINEQVPSTMAKELAQTIEERTRRVRYSS